MPEQANWSGWVKRAKLVSNFQQNRVLMKINSKTSSITFQENDNENQIETIPVIKLYI